MLRVAYAARIFLYVGDLCGFKQTSDSIGVKDDVWSVNGAQKALS